MALTLDDFLEGLHKSRQFFLKHLEGLSEAQWDWKPYPECKSITETLAHLIVDDRAALYSLETGKEPDYEAMLESERDKDKLRAMLDESFAKVQNFLKTKYADAPLDTEVSAFGSPMKLARAIAYLSSEDYYHAGQVAYIRMASDPSWDYYAAIYGSE